MRGVNPSTQVYGNTVKVETLKEGKYICSTYNTFGETCMFAYIFSKDKRRAWHQPEPLNMFHFSEFRKTDWLRGSSKPCYLGFRRTLLGLPEKRHPLPHTTGDLAEVLQQDEDEKRNCLIKSRHSPHSQQRAQMCSDPITAAKAHQREWPRKPWDYQEGLGFGRDTVQPRLDFTDSCD